VIVELEELGVLVMGLAAAMLEDYQFWHLG